MVKRILKILVRCLLIITGFIALYAVAAFSLPHITVNNSFVPDTTGVRILVISNGVHTDIAMPAITPQKDWTRMFPKDTFGITDARYSHIAFGWGDKGFYLHTPKWSDLRFSTAFNAAFGLSTTAMHVRYLKNTHVKENCTELFISEAAYGELIRYIEGSFKQKPSGPVKIQHPGYGHFDRFYEAQGTYSLFKTCNSWTNTGLQTTGVKVACWSPFAAGLMNSLPH